MSALFRSLRTSSHRRESVVKDALINTLIENSRDILYEKKDELDLCELSSALCTTLEAIFLHGLKDSFLWQTINVIAGDEERRPEPTFWAPIMIFLHKQVIEQIQSLSQIASEIGFCRAWIRQSLNESLCSAYLTNIRKNSSALSPYYKRYALIKDADAMEAAIKVMESIETQVIFKLPVNSSLLNQWPDYSLQLSGLWTPPLKSCPITSGIDIAGSIPNESMDIPTPQPVRTNELFSESISNSPFSRTSNFGIDDQTQRENLEEFLQKVDEMEIIDEEKTDPATEMEKGAGKENKEKVRKQRRRSREHDAKIRDFPVDCSDPPSPGIYANSTHGNSLTNLMQTSWSSDLKQSEDALHGRTLQRSVSLTSSSSSLRSPLTDRCSYNTLLRKHERNRELDWTEVWEKFLIQNTGVTKSAEANEDKQNAAERSSNNSPANSDFEVIQNTALENFDIGELQEMVEQLCKLAREPGLDAQGFLCKSCQHPLGIGYTNFRVCAFSGNYFCDACMDVEPVVIPARIIYNWDFRKFPVSKRTMAFLAEFRSQPFIDLKLLNPLIYNASEAMAELQSLRIRLNFLRAYLQTCSAASIELLQQQFFGREYLYEHIHLYSIGDLGLIQRGTLYQQLQKAYKIGEQHVLKCPLCSMKGFICEICKSPRVLYPFHIETTYRCETCGAVFHAHCLNSHQPCPKCERKRKRAIAPLVETSPSVEKCEDDE